MNPAIVTAAVIRRDGCVLLARRPAGAGRRGGWEFPGGKVEPGETEEDGLRRELREELGIEARVGALLGAQNIAHGGRPLHIRFYETVVVSGTPQPREHDGIAWVREEEVTRQELLPADLRFARKLFAVPKPEGDAAANG